MLIQSLLLSILFLPLFVHSQCYSKSPAIWICTNRSKSIDYQTVLAGENFEKFFLKNYQLTVFQIDRYPPTLRLFNASNNQFERIRITGKNRTSGGNLRQLILQSNQIRYFQRNDIVLPESLEIISLANNRLEILDARIFLSLKKLTKLDLRNNQLKRILPQLFLSRIIRLTNNPLECRCTPEFYRIICEKSTNVIPALNESRNCLAPYYESQLIPVHPSAYLRFSTFTLVCPISANPPPIIIWSTPFGNLTSINSSEIDLLSSDNDHPLYSTLTALSGPLSARTKHRLHAFDKNHLSITRARASLQHSLSCSGRNMLGAYTHHFDFDIQTFVQKRALWHILYTAGFGFLMSLVAGALCMIVKRTSYYPSDHMKTPPIYPTLTTNSAARTPPNFELNQWLSTAAANISDTLEQVRDKLRLGVQHVSEHMGRASELLTQSVQQAGGTIRQAAETSAAYIQSFRETSQQRLNTMRVQTLSSFRSSGQFMRAGMHMLTTQVNSLRDYCGALTGHAVSANYLAQQQQLHHIRNSTLSIAYLRQQQIPTIREDDEYIFESTTLMDPRRSSPYVGDISSDFVINASGIGQLDAADGSVLAVINNLNSDGVVSGQLSGGIGTFHDHHHHHQQQDDLVNEPERLIIYGGQRPFSSSKS